MLPGRRSRRLSQADHLAWSRLPSRLLEGHCHCPMEVTPGGSSPPIRVLGAQGRGFCPTVRWASTWLLPSCLWEPQSPHLDDGLEHLPCSHRERGPGQRSTGGPSPGLDGEHTGGARRPAWVPEQPSHCAGCVTPSLRFPLWEPRGRPATATAPPPTPGTRSLSIRTQTAKSHCLSTRELCVNNLLTLHLLSTYCVPALTTHTVLQLPLPLPHPGPSSSLCFPGPRDPGLLSPLSTPLMTSASPRASMSPGH